MSLISFFLHGVITTIITIFIEPVRNRGLAFFVVYLCEKCTDYYACHRDPLYAGCSCCSVCVCMPLLPLCVCEVCACARVHVST